MIGSTQSAGMMTRWASRLWEREHAVPCPKRQMGTVYCHTVHWCDGSVVASAARCMIGWLSGTLRRYR